MAAFRTLLILFGALAVLTLGATSLPAEAGTPPCHSQDHPSAPADQPASKVLKVMNCCVACVAAPRIEPPATPAAVRTSGDVFAASPSVLAGLTPRPAHGPPRA